ncbi:Hephaestin [Acipenser ruthenus]|uniref:ferroxidase n=1 Tax=Acipenser ruthenus TaxID=7906 RepID=A0A444UXH6_ACIRT|nr:Hephaestin [Acipenser ruthenus]
MSLALRAFCFLNLLVSIRGATRLYFLGIREIEWDYIPTGRNEITGQNFTEDEEAANFLSGGADRIGRVYKKAVYKQYSDSTYSTEVTQPTWLGFLGALYPDLMSGSAKLDDAVPPGGSHKYTWNVNVDHAPTTDDPSCLTWAYHSHVDAPRDIASGLIGALLTCKPAINGFMYGNLPGLEMCAGNSISWHLLGMGSETDVHTAFFHGQALTVRHQRTDVVSLFPATFVTAEMVPRNIGKWLLSCNEHLPAGLGALFNVKKCTKMSSVNHLTEKVRKYFIAAQQVLWNYGSSRTEKDVGQALEMDHSYSVRGEDRLGGVYWKAKYVEYTDERFDTEKLRSTSEEHLGILGPVIKAEVGDTILVTFLNRASRAYSIQPHGVIYKKDFEGTRYNDGVSGDGESVEPLRKFTYEWTVPEYAGPTPSDPPCLTRMYFSAVDPVRDTNSGLVGPLLICKAGTLTRGNHQKEVDNEFFLLFTKFDENLSWYLRQSLKHASMNVYDINFEDAGFKESNVMNTINGFSYNTLPGLQMCRGSNVSWQLLGLGSQEDIHAMVFQGNTLQLHGRHRDSLTLLPHTSASALMQPDNIGSFGIICQTSGMKQEYQVFECNKDEAPSLPHYRVQPTYYLAAEEMEWDYSPDRVWELEKMNSSAQDSYGHVFVGKEEGLIGSKYQKVVYREYTDGTFTTRRAHTAEEEHLGILGPLIRAEVGDIILIVFKNKASRKYSLHAHGAQETNGGNIPAAEPAINGKIYGNLHGLAMYEGERVDWYLLGMGQEIDMHTVHFHAESFTYMDGTPHRADVFDLFPATFQTIEMTVSNPGTWLLHCHVTDHIHAGMETTACD